jgi:3-oxoacyl-[acyl-carrier protein] reductase
MEQLVGKVAVVTGGTRGIGRAIAERLLREGVSVAICGRTEESTGRAAREMQSVGSGRVLGYAADITQFDQVQQLFRVVDNAFGGMDILVNNAGQGVFRKVAEMTIEEWRRNIDLNLSGVFYCSHEALPRLTRRGGGTIVNISSLAGKNAFSGGAGYNASKFGLNGFSEAMMLDHRYDNIRVSYIMPGSVDTGFGSGDVGRRAENTNWMIAPEDVAEVVLMILNIPEHTMVSRVEMQPSRPQKSQN